MEQSRHVEGVTSVKVHHPSGGASSFSLGGGYGDEPEKKVVKPSTVPAVKEE